MKYLQDINSPKDLKGLSIEQLEAVCGDLREFIIEQLSNNPGHFGSSLGTVELTVALHYLYNTPYDRLVWDVGHQAYGHKILTGRRDRFSTNRKLGGLSGFTNRMKVSTTRSRQDTRPTSYRQRWEWRISLAKQ